MKKKGAVSLTIKVLIGLVISIIILMILFVVWAKVWAILLPKSDEEVFQELIAKIENLKILEENKKEPVDQILYFLTKKHFLIGFDESEEKIELWREIPWIKIKLPSWTPSWVPSSKKILNTPLRCVEEGAICICKCDVPIEEDSCKDYNCRVIEGFSFIEYYKDEKSKKAKLFIEPGAKRLLELSKKDSKLIIRSLS